MNKSSIQERIFMLSSRQRVACEHLSAEKREEVLPLLVAQTQANALVVIAEELAGIRRALEARESRAAVRDLRRDSRVTLSGASAACPYCGVHGGVVHRPGCPRVD